MRFLLTVIFLGLTATSALADEDIVLRGMGSFHIGSRTVEISGKPIKEVVLGAGGVPAKFDPNGLYQVEGMYVQYFLPKDRKGKVPLLMWHGGGLTGVTYESTPDGREGWLNMFIRKGWDVYNSDAVERGRSGFAAPDIWKSEPSFLTKANPFERFRIGAGPGSWNADPAKMITLPGSQFPVEAYDNFVRVYPEFLRCILILQPATSRCRVRLRASTRKCCPSTMLLTRTRTNTSGEEVAHPRSPRAPQIVASYPLGSITSFARPENRRSSFSNQTNDLLGGVP